MNVISRRSASAAGTLSQGILSEVLEATIVCRFNDAEAVEGRSSTTTSPRSSSSRSRTTSAPCRSRAFLEQLRELATKHGDRPRLRRGDHGFRHGLGGYQAIAGVTPDLTTLGKAMANGWPVSALGGKAELMDLFSTTPAAGLLRRHLQRSPGHDRGGARDARQAPARARTSTSSGSGSAREGLRALYARLGVPVVVAGFGSVFVTYFLEGPVESLRRPAAERRRPLHRLPARADAPRDLRAAAEPEAEPLLGTPTRTSTRCSRRPSPRSRGAAARVTASPVTCTIDLSASGKQLGRLQLPKITNTRLGEHLHPDCVGRERRRAECARPGRQPRRRVRGAGRRPPPDPGARAGQVSGA